MYNTWGLSLKIVNRRPKSTKLCDCGGGLHTKIFQNTCTGRRQTKGRCMKLISQFSCTVLARPWRLYSFEVLLNLRRFSIWGLVPFREGAINTLVGWGGCAFFKGGGVDICVFQFRGFNINIRNIYRKHFKFYKILCLLGSVCIIKRRFSNYRSIFMVNVAY